MKKDRFDIIAVGAGVTTMAFLWILTFFTNVRRVLVLEKESWVGMVNSNPRNNAQTSHDGGTETNYSLEHALEVQKAAVMLRRFVERIGDLLLFRKRKRMVLAVGADEVAQLRKRFEEFASYYPDLYLAEWDELVTLEPKIMEGRDSGEPILAMVSKEGYIINYQRLAETFLSESLKKNPAIEVRFGTSVKMLSRDNEGFVVETGTGELFYSRTAFFGAGAFSLYFAQMLRLGLDYIILSVAGSFYSAGKQLLNKVYRMQIEGLPFAAIHGDPDILDLNDTRFGPTTKPLPVMERHRYKTMGKLGRIYLRSPLYSFWSLFKLLFSKQLLFYVLKNWLYDLPLLGPALFLLEARVIVPSLRYRDLKLRRGAGGIRPQIIDLRTSELIMGNVSIEGDGCLFNTTPSPGASVCLANAKRDVAKIVAMLGGEFTFNESAFEAEYEESHQEIKKCSCV